MVRKAMLGLLLISCTIMSQKAVAQDEGFSSERNYYDGFEGAPDAYAKTRCWLEIHTPRTPAHSFPTVVWFHGGGLKGGDRSKGKSVAKRFNAAGIAVVLVDYRLSPKAKCPAYIEDAAAAVAWTVNNIRDYQGDPNKVFVSGHSAGGYLTAMVGLDPSYLAKHGVATSKLAGLLPVSGQMITHTAIREERGIPKKRPVIDKFAPAYHASKDSPPCLCIVGGQDLPARLEENTYATAAFQAAGNTRFTCRIFPGRDHTTIKSQIPEDDDVVAAAMFDFIYSVLKSRSAADAKK